ncbi:MAG: hypothetical protein Q4G28_12745 [Neisseria sp.]|nr:hypothetical protein [Neisseria sp.]
MKKENRQPNRYKQLVDDAAEAANKAEDDMIADKQSRQSSLWARTVDFFVETPAEKAFAQTIEDLEQARKQGIFAIQTSEPRRVSIDMTSSEEALWDEWVHEYQHQEVESQSDKIDELIADVEAAIAKVRSARTACQTASSVEMFDLFTKSKAVSVWSSLESSSAANKIRMAEMAVQKLANSAEMLFADKPNDWLDLVLDLNFSPTWDILSFFNMRRLDRVTEVCRETEGKLESVLQSLRQLRGQLQNH